MRTPWDGRDLRHFPIRHRQDGDPCRPVRPLLDATVAGARGVRSWYARAHAARCPACGRYLASRQPIVDVEGDAEETSPA